MKVKDLIEELKKCDENLNVYIHGYEGGVHDLKSISEPITVALNVNTEWYYGKHEQIEGEWEGERYRGYERADGILL